MVDVLVVDVLELVEVVEVDVVFEVLVVREVLVLVVLVLVEVDVVEVLVDVVEVLVLVVEVELLVLVEVVGPALNKLSISLTDKALLKAAKSSIAPVKNDPSEPALF